MQKMSGTQFEWPKWRAGSYVDLGLANHTEILHKKDTIRRYAVGWCDSLHNPIRQKINHMCVMFFKDGKHFWSHLTAHEFREIFGDING